VKTVDFPESSLPIYQTSRLSNPENTVLLCLETKFVDSRFGRLWLITL